MKQAINFVQPKNQFDAKGDVIMNFVNKHYCHNAQDIQPMDIAPKFDMINRYTHMTAELVSRSVNSIKHNMGLLYRPLTVSLHP